jgi:hypothetical protein
LRRVFHRTHQLVQSHPIKLRAAKRWTPRGPLSAPPILPLAQTLYHEVVHLIEFPVGIPRPEIVPPAANDGRQFRDDLLHILPALSRPSVLAYTIPEFLRRLRAWPSLHKMPVRVALDASFLANRASQEYAALLPVSQVHQPRVRGMQSQSEPFHYQPDPPERFPGRRFRPAQSHEIVAISDQDSKLATACRPDPIQLVQVDVGQQRRDHSPYTKGNFEFERVVRSWRTRSPVLDLRRKR